MAATTVERLEVLIEANTKAYENAMKKLQAQTSAALKAVQEPKPAKALETIGSTAKLSTNQLQNMSFQLNDIAVSLASGQSPFRVIAQQGAQIAQMFSPGTGVGAALKSVGSGIVSFLANPLTLATIGFTAAAGAAEVLFDAIKNGGNSAEAVLKANKEIGDEITAAFTDAGRAAQKLNLVSLQGLQIQVQTTADKLKSLTQNSLLGATTTLNQIAGFYTGGPLGKMIDDFVTSIRNGTGDVGKFNTQLSDLMQRAAAIDPHPEEIRKLWQEIEDAIDPSLKFNRELAEANARLAVLAGNADDAQKALVGLEGAMVDPNAPIPQRKPNLLGIAPPKETKASGNVNAVQEAINQTNKETAAIEAQNVMFGQGKTDVDRYVRALELYAIAAANNIPLTSKLIGQIADTVDANKAAADAQEALNQKLKANQDAANLLANSMYDAFSGIADGSETATQALKKLVQQLLQAVLQAELLGTGPLAGILGTAPATAGAPAGILGSLAGSIFGLGRAGGGPVNPGMAYPVGERGPELFIPNTAGRVAANRNGGGNTTVIVENPPAGTRTEKRSTPQGDIVRVICGEVFGQIADGKADGVFASRFGATPLTRKRV